MTKYIFTKNRLKATPYCHAKYIQKDYDIIPRVIIFEKERIVYIRVNELSRYQGLEYKQKTYQYNKSLKSCEAYLKRNYKKYKVYNSYNIFELPDQIQRDILNS